MTAEQLEGVAQRAWRRAREHNPEGEEAGPRADVVLRLKTRNVAGMRPPVEERLEESAKKWRLTSVVPGEDGITIIEYTVTPKKNKNADDLLAAVRAAGGAELLSAELQ
jgi:hypothetical protein